MVAAILGQDHGRQGSQKSQGEQKPKTHDVHHILIKLNIA
jgi:hypothetical protein